MRKQLITPLILFFVMLSVGLQAQLTHYEWDYYGIGFSVARDFQVLQNDGSMFYAASSDQQLYVTVSPWSDANVTVNNLYNTVVAMATNWNYYFGGPVVGDYIEIDDYDGYYMITAPNNAELYNYIIVALLLDIETDTNMAVTIGYTYEQNINEAVNLLMSFYAYD